MHKCEVKGCFAGEKCGNAQYSNMLIEDGTMSSFNLNSLDNNVKVDKKKKG